MDYDSDTLTDSTYDNIYATNAATARRYDDNLSVVESDAREASAALIGANAANTNDGKTSKVPSGLSNIFCCQFFAPVLQDSSLKK